MVELQDLRIEIGRQAILDGASARLDSGNVVALIGENGAGKTTLLRALAGLLPLAGGSVALDGKPQDTASPAWMSLVSYVADRNDLLPEISAREHFEVLRRLWDIGREESLRREERLLRLMGIGGEDAEVPAKLLSFGYQKRLAIALSLFTPRLLFLFDEPFNGLDLNSMAIFEAIVDFLRAAGKIVLISTHNLAQIGKSADKTLLLSGGKSSPRRTGPLPRSLGTSSRRWRRGWNGWNPRPSRSLPHRQPQGDAQGQLPLRHPHRLRLHRPRRALRGERPPGRVGCRGPPGLGREGLLPPVRALPDLPRRRPRAPHDGQGRVGAPRAPAAGPRPRVEEGPSPPPLLGLAGTPHRRRRPADAPPHPGLVRGRPASRRRRSLFFSRSSSASRGITSSAGSSVRSSCARRPPRACSSPSRPSASSSIPRQSSRESASSSPSRPRRAGSD